jgi:hypothetical protein
MLAMLVAWNSAGEIVATLDHMVAQDEDGNVRGLIDFDAHETAGGRLTDIWKISNAIGSGTWPEWLGSSAHGFKVELQGKRIKALVHKDSGHRRERADVETAIQERITDARGKPADIRDLVGGPDRPLLLDDNGRTKARVRAERPPLPVIKAR